MVTVLPQLLSVATLVWLPVQTTLCTSICWRNVLPNVPPRETLSLSDRHLSISGSLAGLFGWCKTTKEDTRKMLPLSAIGQRFGMQKLLCFTETVQMFFGLYLLVVYINALDPASLRQRLMRLPWMAMASSGMPTFSTKPEYTVQSRRTLCHALPLKTSPQGKHRLR